MCSTPRSWHSWKWMVPSGSQRGVLGQSSTAPATACQGGGVNPLPANCISTRTQSTPTFQWSAYVYAPLSNVLLFTEANGAEVECTLDVHLGCQGMAAKVHDGVHGIIDSEAFMMLPGGWERCMISFHLPDRFFKTAPGGWWRSWVGWAVWPALHSCVR